jgi:putative ABC transport system permease protein
MSWHRFIRRKRSDAELAKEMEQHLAQETHENIARGMSPEEARRQAYLKFGSPRRVREELWRQNTIAPIDAVWRNVRYTARTLRRAPGFTLLAVLVMALGIGANTALFTIVRSVLLKPLPFPNPDRLVMLYQHDPAAKDQDNYVAAGNFADWQKASHSFASMAMVTPWASYDVAGDSDSVPEKIAAAWCSWNLFSVLGAQPAYGRVFTAADDRQSADATVVLSWGFWKRRFAGNPSILGQQILFNGRPYTVIGVMPRWFDFPLPQIQVWTPAHHEGSERMLQARDDHEFQVVGRLKPGSSLAEAVSELDTVQKHILQANPGLPIEPGVSGRILLNDMVRDAKTPLYAMLAATGCLLLIACLNVAGLLVARSAARRREIAIRAALGGNRWRLFAERLTESLLLSCAGGALGAALAYLALDWLKLARPDMARIDSLHIDGVVLLFVAAVTLGTGMLAGVIPALGRRGEQLLEALQESSHSHSSGRSKTRLREILLTAEIALTAALLITAGLLVRSYEKLRTVDLGCATKNVLTMQMTLSGARYKSPEQKVAYLSELVMRARALPGVEAAGLVTVAPGAGWWEDSPVSVVEHPPVPIGMVLDPISRSADPGYFAAMQIPLLRGRVFTESDRLQNGNVAILSRKAAEQFFPDEDPIGKHLRILHQPDAPVLQIVGVVGDTRFHVSEDIWPMMYQPVFSGRFAQASVVVRTKRDADALARPLQQIATQLDRTLPVGDVMTMDQIIGRSTRSANFDSMLVLAFAVIALVLAAAGLYGAQSYLVTQRTGEIGIRMALGAQRGQVVKLVLMNGLGPVCAGLALGLTGGAFAVRLIRSMLYGTNPLDLRVFAAASLLLSAVAALACIVPAWRAARLNPLHTLRAE